jgi:hypothetical protein
MSNSPPTFLTLPVEIRLQIYAEVFSPWFKHTPPLGPPYGEPDHPLGITSVCQQTRHESFPLILIDPRHLYSGPSLWELTRQGEQKYMDLLSAVTVDFDKRTLLEFQKDLLLAPKDISKTVPYSGEWWLATYQSRMSWLPRTPPSPRPSTSLSLWRFLFPPKPMSWLPRTGPSTRLSLERFLFPPKPAKSIIISTWETFHKLPNLRKFKISLQKLEGPIFLIGDLFNTENEQRLLLEMISFTCPNIESLTVPINTSSPCLILTSCTNFHNLEHVNWNGQYATFPKGGFPIVNQSLRRLRVDGHPKGHEAVMGGSGGSSVVTIIPPDDYMQAFQIPKPFFS